ncbi:hypothetical protein SDC9_132285 [bioreactor metagenome]|uniref:Uncharacterized protein n=1 Tax=bioreactor metagenome TaxID=1076179 RepID=A0A645D7N9_9ZZZZ
MRINSGHRDDERIGCQGIGGQVGGLLGVSGQSVGSVDRVERGQDRGEVGHPRRAFKTDVRDRGQGFCDLCEQGAEQPGFGFLPCAGQGMFRAPVLIADRFEVDREQAFTQVTTQTAQVDAVEQENTAEREH